MLRRLFRGRLRPLGFVVASAFLAGLAQAGVLVIVVGVGVSLTADDGNLRAPLLPDSLLASTTSAILLGTALLALAVVLEVAASIVAARMGSAVLAHERTTAYKAFSQATWSVQAAERDGHLQELMSKNAGWAGTAVSSATNGVIALCSLVALGISAVGVSPTVAFALALAFGLLLAASRPMASAVRRRTAVLSALNVELANQITRNVGLSRDIRTFDVEGPVAGEVERSVNNVSTHWVGIRIMNRLAPLVFRSAGLLVILGSLLIVDMSTADDLAVMGTVVVLGLRGLGYAGATQRSYQELQTAAPWLDQLWDRQDALASEPLDRGTEALDRIDTVSFADVGFHYRSDDSTPDAPVLRSLDFTVERGESIGVVGPSGAGKSTLVKLLLRLHDPESGDLLVNGMSARSYRLDDWYQRVGYVPQDVSTFNGTIAENIAFFRSDVSSAQIERAARHAHLHHEIVALPDGYETLVGERAGRLSGGQRQRLALARALVGDPDVLVLDEPTSALDPQSEELVQRTIDELGGSITLFIIAHRISTLSSCEKIVVLENGKVTALGSPSRVRDSSDFFREATRLARR